MHSPPIDAWRVEILLQMMLTKEPPFPATRENSIFSLLESMFPWRSPLLKKQRIRNHATLWWLLNLETLYKENQSFVILSNHLSFQNNDVPFWEEIFIDNKQNKWIPKLTQSYKLWVGQKHVACSSRSECIYIMRF